LQIEDCRLKTNFLVPQSAICHLQSAIPLNAPGFARADSAAHHEWYCGGRSSSR
jgi:hypothetical protein